MDWEWLTSLLGPSSANAAGILPAAEAAIPALPPIPGPPQTPIQWLFGRGGAPMEQQGPPTPPPMPAAPSTPSPSLGALLDPTGGMTPQDYGSGPNIGGPQGALPQTSMPTAGNFGGSPETNPLLRPQAGPAGSSAPSGGNNLLNALKGVQIPKPPAPQSVHTPAAPRPSTAIHGGELLQLIQMLNASGAAQRGGLQLPSTLGGAIAGR